jgi:hypothetical protein
LTYPRESVIAEKLEAIVFLGVPNSRMKDLHDIRSLSRGFSFDGALLSQAIKKTFATRGTELPADIPKVFTAEFFDDANKKKQWAAFCSKNKNYVEEASLESVSQEISTFIMPIIEALHHKKPIPQAWSTGSWQS